MWLLNRPPMYRGGRNEPGSFKWYSGKGHPAMRRQMLLQSILGHLALLEEKHPRKAATPVARRAKRYVTHSLAPAAPGRAGQRRAA